jgi:hypothetical protein
VLLASVNCDYYVLSWHCWVSQYPLYSLRGGVYKCIDCIGRGRKRFSCFNLGRDVVICQVCGLGRLVTQM